jgi:hypothetical protein
MARAAKRKVQVNDAASMANRRDAGLIRAMRFKDISKIMNDRGPGDPNAQPVIYQIDMDVQLADLISTFMWAFLEVMQFDMAHPSFFTPHKVDEWKSIATEIYRHNNRKEDTKKVFMRIARQLGACSKKMTDLIHYEATEEELQYALYDVILKITMDNNLDIKGMFPEM